MNSAAAACAHTGIADQFHPRDGDVCRVSTATRTPAVPDGTAHAVNVDRKSVRRLLDSDARKLSAFDRERVNEMLSNSRNNKFRNYRRFEICGY